MMLRVRDAPLLHLAKSVPSCAVYNVLDVQLCNLTAAAAAG
jgi:hypothetical protein